MPKSIADRFKRNLEENIARTDYNVDIDISSIKIILTANCTETLPHISRCVNRCLTLKGLHEYPELDFSLLVENLKRSWRSSGNDVDVVFDEEFISSIFQKVRSMKLKRNIHDLKRILINSAENAISERRRFVFARDCKILEDLYCDFPEQIEEPDTE